MKQTRKTYFTETTKRTEHTSGGSEMDGEREKRSRARFTQTITTRCVHVQFAKSCIEYLILFILYSLAVKATWAHCALTHSYRHATHTHTLEVFVVILCVLFVVVHVFLVSFLFFLSASAYSC